ncbi:MAG: alanine racemase [Chloroflexota bacterium]|nr:alanine racemase [Chloroflexota bacterium]
MESRGAAPHRTGREGNMAEGSGVRALPCWLDVDLDAVASNVAALRRWVGPRTRIAAVVKAEGYGIGAEAVSRAALDAGASWLAVARIHEARELRVAGIDAPILVMNRTDLSEVEDAVRLDLRVTVDTPELANALGRAARRMGRRAHVHLKVDTGLHRFGVEPEQALPLARALGVIDGLDVEGLYTHFASADEDPEYTREQLTCFQATSAALAADGYLFPVRHAANSAGTLGFRDAHLDLVRVGITLYGVSPTGSTPPGLPLQPAVGMRASVARVSDLGIGEGVGYGQTWRATRPTRVALVTAGYADGVSRALSNRGSVLVRGVRAPIIGRVSMDQITVDVTDIPGVAVGDVVTLFGSDGDAEISLHEYAGWCDTISYEALTRIGPRVARVYHADETVTRTARLSGVRDVL